MTRRSPSRLAPETRLELERLLESLSSAVFAARDSLGWTYQFWQAERKDAVNKSGVKIGAEELPAVTQLFTERYMVLFLLHNTVGAWRAGRILAAQPELAATATSEDELRRAVRLEAHGGYGFSYLRFVREPRDGDEAEQPTGPWRPAAGSFAGWPRTAAELRVLDPCCGSGHFLVECLDLLVRLRMEEERLAPGAAVEAVLRDNLFGLEIDPRCTQIAAFNLALAAWTWPGADGHRPLPALNLSCSGLAPNATRDDWIAMAEAAADAGGLPAKRDLLGVDDSLMSAPLRNSLGALHDLFVQAPVLGSLIDPRALQADLFQHDYESVRVLLGALLEQEGANDEQTERAVTAQGMARAAELLAGPYHLVITNVPYLARRQAGGSTEAVRAGPVPGREGRSGHPVRLAWLRLARQARRAGGGDAAELAVPDQLQEAPGDAAKAEDVEPRRPAGARRVRDHRWTCRERRAECAVRGPAHAKLAHGRHRCFRFAGPTAAQATRKGGVAARGPHRLRGRRGQRYFGHLAPGNSCELAKGTA